MRLLKYGMTIIIVLSMWIVASITGAQQELSTAAISPTSPIGDILTDNPRYDFTLSTNPNVTWYNIIVENETTTVVDEWFAASDICSSGCSAFPDVVLSSGTGDVDLSWTLREYDASTTNITIVGTSHFTLLAPHIEGPASFTGGSGAPEFVVEDIAATSGDQPSWYRLYVQKIGATSPVLDEWVSVDSCGSGSCTLVPPQLPIYENGAYNVWMQAFTQDSTFGYSAWSDAFAFNVNMPQPSQTTAPILGVFHKFNYAPQSDQYITQECAEASEDNYTCNDTEPIIAVGLMPYEGTIIIPPPQEVGRIIHEGRAVDDIPFPNPNTGTQYFQIKIESGATIIHQEWIDSFTDDRCFAANSVFGVCLIIPPTPLVNGTTYSVSTRSYNPGGTSPHQVVANITVDLQQDIPADLLVDVISGEVMVEWTNTYMPEWAEVAVEQNGTIVYSKWMQPGTIEELIAEGQINGGGGEATFLNLFKSNIPCNYNEVDENYGCQHLLDTALLNGSYTIKVRAYNDEILTSYATINHVQDYAAPVVPATPGGATVQRLITDIEGNTSPSFLWVATEASLWHNIVIENSSGTPIYDEWNYWAYACNLEADTTLSCAYQTDIVLEPGDYSWRIRAWGPGGMGNWMTEQPLNISDAPVTAPTLITPTGSITANEPVFTWVPGDNTSWYEIDLKTASSDTIYKEWIYLPAWQCDPDCEFHLPDDYALPAGSYTWQLRGANTVDVSAWTSITSFNITTELEAPELLAPIPDTMTGDVPGISDQVTFVWEPGQGVTWYQIAYAQFEADGEEIYSDWINAEELGNECDYDYTDGGIIIELRENITERESADTDGICSYTLPVDDLPAGGYVWALTYWGPGFPVDDLPIIGLGAFWKL